MIGIFDSGLGGLTALKEIRKIMPDEDIVYFGDTGRVPYGTKSSDTIKKYSNQDMRFLMSHKIDAAVAACGTVSSTALDELHASFDIPIVGVVEGASERAAQLTKNGKVGVIGTTATVASRSYEKYIKKINPNIEVSAYACPLFVPLVENGVISRDDEVLKLVCRRYLEPIREQGIDTLILGCTHYPIIKDAIADALPGVALVNTGAEAALKLCRVMDYKPGESGKIGRTEYYVSDTVDGFAKTASVFLETEITEDVKKINIEEY